MKKLQKRCSSRKHGVRVFSPPEGCAHLLCSRNLTRLLTPEQLCIVAYYRSAADDERSKSLAPSSLPVLPELQAAETSASPPSPRQSTSTAAFSWNRDAFSLIRFRPRVLRNVLPVDLSTSILGHRSRMPVYISPAAMGRLAHPEGEKCLVRTAAAHGIPYVVCAFCFCFAGDQGDGRTDCGSGADGCRFSLIGFGQFVREF